MEQKSDLLDYEALGSHQHHHTPTDLPIRCWIGFAQTYDAQMRSSFAIPPWEFALYPTFLCDARATSDIARIDNGAIIDDGRNVKKVTDRQDDPNKTVDVGELQDAWM